MIDPVSSPPRMCVTVQLANTVADALCCFVRHLCTQKHRTLEIIEAGEIARAGDYCVSMPCLSLAEKDTAIHCGRVLYDGRGWVTLWCGGCI